MIGAMQNPIPYQKDRPIIRIRPMKGTSCKICTHELSSEPVLEINKPDRFEAFIGVDEKSFKRTWHRCSSCAVLQAVHYNGMDEKLAQISDKYYSIDFGSLTSGSRFERIQKIPDEKSDNYHRVRRIGDFYRNWIQSFEKSSTPSILDIGGGMGVFLCKYLEVNPDFTGVMIEPDRESTTHIDSSFPFEFHNRLFSGQEEYQRDFDIVTLNKVVEHIEKPHQLLSDIQKVLNKKHGLLYIEIPDEMNVYYKPSSDNSLGSLHHHLYNPHSLNYLLESTGYTVLRIERMFEASGKISIYAFAISSIAEKQWLTH